MAVPVAHSCPVAPQAHAVLGTTAATANNANNRPNILHPQQPTERSATARSRIVIEHETVADMTITVMDVDRETRRDGVVRAREETEHHYNARRT
jgi:hypothetical protein